MVLGRSVVTPVLLRLLNVQHVPGYRSNLALAAEPSALTCLQWSSAYISDAVSLLLEFHQLLRADHGHFGMRYWKPLFGRCPDSSINGCL